VNANTLKSSEPVGGQPSHLFEPGIAALNSDPFVVESLPFLRTPIDVVTESPPLCSFMVMTTFAFGCSSGGGAGGAIPLSLTSSFLGERLGAFFAFAQ